MTSPTTVLPIITPELNERLEAFATSLTAASLRLDAASWVEDCKQLTHLVTKMGYLCDTDPDPDMATNVRRLLRNAVIHAIADELTAMLLDTTRKLKHERKRTSAKLKWW